MKSTTGAYRNAWAGFVCRPYSRKGRRREAWRVVEPIMSWKIRSLSTQMIQFCGQGHVETRVFLFLRSSQLADKTWPQCTQFTTRHRRHCAHCRHNMRSSLWSNRQTSDMIHFMGACNIAFYCTRRWKRRFTMFWCLHDDEVYDAVVDHLETHHLSMLY